MSEAPGPYVQTAVFCEQVLQEQDGVLSLIRIVDRITHSAVGPDIPEQMPQVPINLRAVITLKSGDSRGRHQVTIRPEAPSGQQLDPVTLPVLFEGEDRGVNLVVQLGLVVDQEGLYWFDVLLGNRILTRMPLRVVYAPTRTADTTGSPG
jgi:hypothetical protein